MKSNEKFLAQLVEQSVNIIYILNAETLMFLYANQAATKFFGYDLEELRELGIAAINEEGEDEIIAYLMALSEETSELDDAQLTTTHRKNSGSVIPVSIKAQRGCYMENDVFIIYCNDLSYRTAKEAEISQLRAAIDTSPDLVFITDYQTKKYLYVNQAAVNKIGRSLNELLQSGPLDVIGGDAETLEKEFKKVIKSGDQGTIAEIRRTNEADESFWFEMHRHGMKLDERWVITTIARDITLRKQQEMELVHARDELEQRVAERTRQLQTEIEQCRAHENNLKLSEERFYDIASASADGFWETEDKFAFTYIDSEFLKLTGINTESFLGLTRQHFDTEKIQSLNFQENMDDLLHHRPFRNHQFRFEIGENDYRYLSMSGTPVFSSSGQFSGYRGASTDVTSQVEAELLAVKTQKELRITKEEAVKASSAKGAFLSSMSHELRTPLNCILGFAQLLELNKTTLDDKQLVHIKHILSSGEQLLSLVNDVLEFNTIEQGTVSLHFDNIHVNSIVDECIDQLLSKAKERNICVDNQNYDDQLLQRFLWTDPTRLKQLILNLLSNAIKFTSKDSSVAIHYCDTGDGKLKISVTDRGPGIPLDLRKDLFAPFERLGREAGPIEGTGIGLTISKRLVKLLGGDIGFESELNKGSTFWVDIPFSEEQNSEIDADILQNQPPLENSKPSDSTLLLYIEDDPDNQSLMRHILERVPFSDLPPVELITAHNAELGIDLAKAKSPDIILLDINLPGMNGNEAVKLLKSIPETKAVPVIAISADASLQSIDSAFVSGFEAYITKPINVKEFQSKVIELLCVAESA